MHKKKEIKLQAQIVLQEWELYDAWFHIAE